MNDMTRLEAYRILGKMWGEATPEQAEAICMAQNDIEFVDLMPKDMVAVVRCKECKSFGVYECSGNGYCKHNNGLVDPEPDDFCSYGAHEGR